MASTVGVKPGKSTATPAKPSGAPGAISGKVPATSTVAKTGSPVGPGSNYLKPVVTPVIKKKKKVVVEDTTIPVIPPPTNPTVVDSYQNEDGTRTIIYSDGTTRIIGTPSPKISADTKSAFASLRDTFNNYGLTGLATVIQGFMETGLSSNEAYLELIKTSEYKERFSGNAGRLAKGIPVLSEGSYMQAESEYRDLLNQNGLNSMANNQTYAQLIGGDVSVAEAKDRINSVFAKIDNADPALKEQLGNYLTGYGIGDPAVQRSQLANSLLTGGTTAQDLVRNLQKAQIKTAAVTANYTLDESNINSLQQQLETAQTYDVYGTAKKAFGELASIQPNVEKLANIYKEQNLTPQELQQEVFFGLKSKKRAELEQKEIGAFSGQSGMSKVSLSKNTAGQI